MPRVVVDVMPKPEILDAQGKAVLGALARLGYTDVSEVRQGKRFELVVESSGDSDAAALRARMEEIAGTLLANPVIETYAVRVEPDDAPSDETSDETDDETDAETKEST